MDHIKWIVTQDQSVRMTGTLNGAPVDQRSRAHHGSAAVPAEQRRQSRLRQSGQALPARRRQHGRTGYFTFLAKAGGGFAVPHTENTLFGMNNEAGFQFFQGWNLDAVAAARVHMYKGLYFEFEEKFVYARYFGVNIDHGKAGHTVKAAEFAFHFGFSFW